MIEGLELPQNPFLGFSSVTGDVSGELLERGNSVRAILMLILVRSVPPDRRTRHRLYHDFERRLSPAIGWRESRPCRLR